HLVDDVDPRVLGLDAAADDLGGVIDLDVAALAGHLDLRALLRGPLALHIVGAEQAEEHVVIVELRQRRRVGLGRGQLGRIHGGERIVARCEHDVRAVVEDRLDVTAGFACPEINELNVATSGMVASTLLTGWVARSFQLGSAALNASQPEPWGSGIGATGVDTGVLGVAGSAGGSAYALMANGTDATIAAIPAVAPNALLARVFNFGSFVRSHRMVRAANAHSKVVPTTQLRY